MQQASFLLPTRLQRIHDQTWPSCRHFEMPSQSNNHVTIIEHGSLNVPMFHITQPLDSIRYMVYNGYYKVMSNIPKMGHLTTPVETIKTPKISLRF